MKNIQFDFQRISIFYSREDSHKLIGYLNKISNLFPELFNDAFIHFSCDQGYHVRISSPILQDGYVSTFSESVKKFMVKKPSPDVKLIFPLNSLFIDFPNNNIFFGVYEDYPGFTENIPREVLSGIRVALSKIIIKFFSNKKLTTENKFVLFIQLQLLTAMILFTNKSQYEVIANLNTIIDAIGQGRTSLIELKSNNVYTANKRQLNLWYKNIKNRSCAEDLEDLHPWIETFEKWDNDNNNFTGIFLDTCGIVKEHLDLNSTHFTLIALKVVLKVFENQLLTNSLKPKYEKVKA
ncbi:hypothetical protein PBAL39_15354 [Pedobacter sp. BAL39]|uniref:hypothetical protein n=1 Tax=Pedobacter sp. BAL39 TaxID=391596 RepID=UPI0001559CB7|nr:hypothetical protein [Pedobacter sp. BAL39]EDM37814.1 hypothetical protein PBAL39_15354 [Pedobacter sp. BAL39]